VRARPPPPSPPRSLGTLEGTKDVYESILDLRIATPQTVLNYAQLMLERKFFEEAFRRGGAGGRHVYVGGAAGACAGSRLWCCVMARKRPAWPQPRRCG
jgi:hypothetical protein